MARIPTIERLNELLVLDPETGILRWRIFVGSRAMAGAQAGYLHKASGYRFIRIDGIAYREHILIWFMLRGEWCPRLIDHEDRDRSNNRQINLRKANESQQRQNAALRSDNTTGHRGVKLHACGRYNARIYIGGKEKSLGLFASLDEAAEVARTARLEHYGAFAPS